MVLNLNAYHASGDHQTGKGQRVNLLFDGDVFPVEATGVNLTRTELVSEGYLPSATLSASNSIEIAGVTYTADAAYDAALAAQTNVDRVFKAFAAKANVVYMDITPVADDNYVVTAFNNTNNGVEVELVFEQKGFLASGNKGEVTIAAGANYGDTQADVAAVIDGLTLLAADATTETATTENTNFAARVKVSANLQS